MYYIYFGMGAILLICAIVGLRRGLLKMLFGFVAIVVSLAATYFLTPYVSNYVIEETEICDYVEDKIYEGFENSLRKKVEETLKASGVTDEAKLDALTEEQTQELIKHYPSISSLKEAFRVASDFALQNRQAILHIYHSMTRDVFIENTLRLCNYTVTTYIAAAFPDVHLSESDHAALVSVLRSLLLGIVISWIAEGMPAEAIDSMERMIDLCDDVPTMIIQKSPR